MTDGAGSDLDLSTVGDITDIIKHDETPPDNTMVSHGVLRRICFRVEPIADLPLSQFPDITECVPSTKMALSTVGETKEQDHITVGETPLPTI